MAVEWDFVIKPVDIESFIVGIVARRTDDAKEPPETVRVSMKNADISTTEKKAEAMNILWEKYLRKRAFIDRVSERIGDLEQQASDNFMAREA